MARAEELLHRDKISPVFREAYIINGYRRPDSSWWQCIKYTTIFHNDFNNFWSHFLTLWVWLYWLYCTSFQLDLLDPYWYPLVTLYASGCICVLCSSIAHAFACKSLKVRQICFMTDYQGISTYAFGGGIAYYFYERPIDGWISEYKWTFVCIYVLLAINGTLMCSLSRYFLKKQRYILRAASYVLPFLAGCYPFYLRLSTCIYNSDQCIYETLPYHFITFLTSFLMAFFFVSKLPERFSPGTFDYVCSSHQLFHITAVLMTSLQLYILPIDATIRRPRLPTDPYYWPDFNSTILPFLIVAMAGAGIVAVLSTLVVKGILVSNKIEGTHVQLFDLN